MRVAAASEERIESRLRRQSLLAEEEREPLPRAPLQGSIATRAGDGAEQRPSHNQQLAATRRRLARPQRGIEEQSGGAMLASGARQPRRASSAGAQPGGPVGA